MQAKEAYSTNFSQTSDGEDAYTTKRRSGQIEATRGVAGSSPLPGSVEYPSLS